MGEVFYCDSCGDEKRWPRRIEKIRGECQICGKTGFGNTATRDMLPDPPRITGQIAFVWL